LVAIRERLVRIERFTQPNPLQIRWLMRAMEFEREL
jgi:hypothetical protein